MKNFCSFLMFLFITGCSTPLNINKPYGHYQIRADLFSAYQASQSIFVIENNDVRVIGSAIRIDSLSKYSIFVTANHVIEGVEEKQGKGTFIIVGNYRTKKVFATEVIYQNKQTDLAILRSLEKKGKYEEKVFVSTEEPKLGDNLFVIGSPLGIERNISKGILSNVLYNGKIVHYRTDAAIFFGNSGGGVFDTNFRLIGIVSSTEGIIPNLPIPVPGGNRIVGLIHIREALIFKRLI